MTLGHPRILFLASGRNCLQLLAEGLAKATAPPSVEIMGVTIAPAELVPAAIQVMSEDGIDISTLPLRSPLDVEVFLFDLVITLGDFDPSCLPALPGMPPHLHWDVPDPLPGAEAPLFIEELRTARDVRLQQK